MTKGPLLCFWQPHEEHGIFSQWYLSKFRAEGVDHVFVTAEQYMMYRKAILFEDHDSAMAILAEKDPKKNRTQGRAVSNFSEEIWKTQRSKIVFDASYFKFAHSIDEGLKEALLATGERELIEASPRDRIWGIGFGRAKAEQMDKSGPKGRTGWGLNLLGKALMEVRARIREEDETKE